METGSGEISGTKYMNSATGLPADSLLLQSKWRVGPADPGAGLASLSPVSGNNGTPASRGAGVKHPINNNKPSMNAAKPGGLEPPPIMPASGFVGDRGLEVFIG